MSSGSPFVSERLGLQHKIDAFDSAVPALDQWLVRFSFHAQRARTAQTFVWHRGDDVVAGYFSLAAHLVVRADLPARVGRGSPDAIPALLLARLALHTSLQGKGLGGELLWDALSRGCAAADIAAARMIVVDAYDARAAEFYRHHGFVDVPGNRSRLVQKTSDVVAALREPGSSG